MPAVIRTVTLHPAGVVLILADGTEALLALPEELRQSALLTLGGLMVQIHRHTPTQH